MVGRIYGKSKFWVWSGTEMEWCIMKVMMMMMMMMNRWEKDEMTVTGTHHRQVSKFQVDCVCFHAGNSESVFVYCLFLYICMFFVFVFVFFCFFFFDASITWWIKMYINREQILARKKEHYEKERQKENKKWYRACTVTIGCLRLQRRPR